MVRFWKQNKSLKDSEVKVSDVDAQRAQIDLAEMFTQKAAHLFGEMQKLQEQTYEATLKNGNDNENIISQIEKLVNEQKRISDDVSRIAEEQNHIIMFINGEYQEFLKKKGFKKD